LMILGVDIATIAALRLIYAPIRAAGKGGAILRVSLPLFGLIALAVGATYTNANFAGIVAGVVAGDSVSNLTRLSLQVAAFHLFLTHPLFGVGLGQFGFYAAAYLPDWAFRSPELAPMLYYPTAPWPTTYSLYGRLSAELGLVGLIGWVSLWLTIVWRLLGSARDRAKRERSFGIEYPLIASAFGILASGIASETFRTPMFWITLGCSCAVLRSRRSLAAAWFDPGPAQAPVQRRSH
ncbi:MAG: hypothetical protein ABIW33_03775, partial [Sphingomicrobium sp.]